MFTFPLLEGEFCGHFDFPAHQYVCQPSRWAYQIKKKKVAYKYFIGIKIFHQPPLHLGKLPR